MVYCRKCGAPMGDNALSCGKCGAAVDTTEAAETRKSLLIKDLEKYKVLLDEVTELNSMIRPVTEFPVSGKVDFKKKTLMRFFWPYLVGGVGAGSIVYIIAAFIVFYSAVSRSNYAMTKSQANSLSYSMVSDVYIGYFTALIVAVAIILIGLKIAKKKQAAFNKDADMMTREHAENYQKGLKNQKMIDIRDENIRELRRYESLVPEKYQTSEGLAQIIDLIKTDKAATVEEACAIIG